MSRVTSAVDQIHKALLWVILIGTIAATLFPLYWLLRTSFTDPRAIVSTPLSFLPPVFTPNNFRRVLGLVDTQTAVAMGGAGQAFNFFLYLRNTIIVAGLITGGQVLFSAFAAYAFARLRFPMRNLLFGFYLSALMIPAIIVVIPNYLLIHSVGWINTYRGIVAPFFFMTPFAVFFLRQFFLGIHRELEESALIEGAGRIHIFFSIIAPMSIGAFVIISLITFTNSWNEYLWMLITGRAERVRVLTVALGIFQSQTPQGVPDWGGMMAGAALSIIPIILLFMAGGKHLINSIGHTGIK
jgi:multiple sugar transport system permease protein